MIKKLSTQEIGGNEHLKVKNLQDKMLTHGRRALTEYELLMLVLNFGANRKWNSDKLTKILNFCGNQLDELARLSVDEMVYIGGLTQKEGILLSAVWELSNRKHHISSEKIIVRSSSDAKRIFYHSLSDLPHEEFHVAYLNRANRLIRTEIISRGGITATVVDVKIILQKAVLFKASGLILAHNHPSGNLEPSAQDKEITQKIKKGCAYFDINVLDHVIIAGANIFSFADEGLL